VLRAHTFVHVRVYCVCLAIHTYTTTSVLCELRNTQLRNSNHCILKYHCLVVLSFSVLNYG